MIKFPTMSYNSQPPIFSWLEILKIHENPHFDADIPIVSREYLNLPVVKKTVVRQRTLRADDGRRHGHETLG